MTTGNKNIYHDNHEFKFLNISEPFQEGAKNKLFIDKSNKDTWIMNKHFINHVGNKFISESMSNDNPLPIQIPKEMRANLGNNIINKNSKRLFQK